MKDNRFVIHSALKKYNIDQDKVTAPQNTVSHAIEQLQKLHDLSGLHFKDTSLPVKGSHSIRFACEEYQTSGKGLTSDQCKASAIMEFIERYSWLHFDYEKNPGYRIATFKEVAKEKETVCPTYFLSNFFALENKDQLTDKILSIPIKWVEGISLTDGRPFFYPINWHNYVYGTNGLAAGNVMEEAILQAVCELIERDNIFRLFALCEPGNSVNQESIRHPLLRSLIDEVKEAGISILIKDISYDLGIPTFIVQGTLEADADLITHKGVGHGCHPDPHKALIRALSEYFEGLSSTKDSMKRIKTDFKKEEHRKKSLPAHGGFIVTLNPNMLYESKKNISMDDIPDLSHEDIGQELKSILSILSDHGHDMILIDKTDPNLNIPAVRIFSQRMRSVINGEIHSPFRAMSGLCYEAFDDQSADAFIRQFYLDISRLSDNLSGMFNALLIPPSASTFFCRNFQESLLNLMRQRKRIFSSAAINTFDLLLKKGI
ncbi:MAG: YcaO-like family protein [Desulfobacterales bacterium]|nr:YcaO-like family protein [Desulfobacterales bacterium]MBF0396006.1 YcaO-like family protein [Desulfobacterales bacterium]